MAMIVDLSKRWQNDDMPCLRRNPEMFFSDTGTDGLARPTQKTQREWDRAKAVCATCPVIKECARDNLGEMEGVWGGLDPAQRIRLRSTHSFNVRKLTGPVKLEYAKLAHMLRTERKLGFQDIGRIIGIGPQTAQYLWQWYVDWEKLQKAETPKVVDLELPEPKKISANAEWPKTSPVHGDAWIRYARRVVYGHYLGQTEDDAWYSFRVRLAGVEYSVAWFKAEDVKFTRDVARVVLTRVGKGSRIYGTALSPDHRRTSQAG